LDDLTNLPFSGQNVPVVVNRVLVAGPRAIVITLLGDSVIQYDPILGMIRPVFHPGTSMNVVASRSGLLAFNAFNSYKALCFDLK